MPVLVRALSRETAPKLESMHAWGVREVGEVVVGWKHESPRGLRDEGKGYNVRKLEEWSSRGVCGSSRWMGWGEFHTMRQGTFCVFLFHFSTYFFRNMYYTRTVLQWAHSDLFVHGVNFLWLENLISLGKIVLFFFSFLHHYYHYHYFYYYGVLLDTVITKPPPPPPPFPWQSNRLFWAWGEGCIGLGGLLVPFSVSPPAVSDTGAAAPNHLNNR